MTVELNQEFYRVHKETVIEPTDAQKAEDRVRTMLESKQAYPWLYETKKD